MGMEGETGMLSLLEPALHRALLPGRDPRLVPAGPLHPGPGAVTATLPP